MSIENINVNNNISTYSCFYSVGCESPPDTKVTGYIQAIKRQLSHRPDISTATSREKARLREQFSLTLQKDQTSKNTKQRKQQ